LRRLCSVERVDIDVQSRVLFGLNEPLKVAGSYQCFNFVLECRTLVYGAAIIAVVLAILTHGGMRSACRASSNKRDLGIFRGAYVNNRIGLDSFSQ